MKISIPVNRPLLETLRPLLGSRLLRAKGAAQGTQRCWPGRARSRRAPPVWGGGVVIKIERDEESAHVNKKPRDRKEIVKQVHAIKFDHEI